MRASLKRRADILRSIKDRIGKIDRHDATGLLIASLRHLRVNYNLRTGACFSSREAIEGFDDAVRDGFCGSAYVALGNDVWQRASFYPSDGVVGILS